MTNSIKDSVKKAFQRFQTALDNSTERDPGQMGWVVFWEGSKCALESFTMSPHFTDDPQLFSEEDAKQKCNEIVDGNGNQPVALQYKEYLQKQIDHLEYLVKIL